jgi:hypothetical protein
MAKLYRLLVVAQALVVFSYCIFSYIYQPNMIYLSSKRQINVRRASNMRMVEVNACENNGFYC